MKDVNDTNKRSRVICEESPGRESNPIYWFPTMKCVCSNQYGLHRCSAKLGKIFQGAFGILHRFLPPLHM